MTAALEDSACVFLIGMMGSGKSSVGELLAAQLHYRFMDTDEVIARASGQSVNEIFQNAGEDVFREMEHNLVQEFPTLSNTVIAAGGGMPVQHDHLQVMRSCGTVIYLQTSLKILVNRLEAERASRPLLRQTDWKEQMANLFAIRKSIYEQADLVIACDQKKIKEIVEEITRRLTPTGHQE